MLRLLSSAPSSWSCCWLALSGESFGSGWSLAKDSYFSLDGKVTKRSRLHRLHCYGRRLRCRIWTRFAQTADAPEASSSSFADVHPLMPFIERVAFFGDCRHRHLYNRQCRPSPEEVKLPKKASAGERKAQQPEWAFGASAVWAKRVRRRQRT